MRPFLSASGSAVIITGGVLGKVLFDITTFALTTSGPGGAAAVFFSGSVTALQITADVGTIVHSEALQFLTSKEFTSFENSLGDALLSYRDQFVQAVETPGAPLPNLGVALADGFVPGYGTSPTIAESMQNANAAVAQASNTVVQQRLYDPLVADLDGNGIEMVGLQNSSVFFDLDTSNPGLEHTGWVSPKDGFFAIRPEGGQPIRFDNLLRNNTIDGFDELRLYDSNGDRVLHASDPYFTRMTCKLFDKYVHFR
jgi:hypothetical protein